MKNLKSVNLMDSGFKRLFYTRYADDFIIMVIGSKDDTLWIRDRIAEFLEDTLNLELNREKTKVTNLQDENPRYLGFEICRLKHDPNNNHSPSRRADGRLTLLMPKDVITEKIKKVS